MLKEPEAEPKAKPKYRFRHKKKTKPRDNPASQDVDQTSDKPTEQPADKPSNKLDGKPSDKPTDKKPAGKPRKKSARKPRKKLNGEQRAEPEATPYSMFPSHHDNVAHILRECHLDFAFHDADDDQTFIDEYDTNVVGRFTCPNRGCTSRTKGWSSGAVPITIRRYTGFRYNARVYHQSCQTCKTRATPHLDESYAERVAYRLKKWSGVAVEPPFYQSRTNRPPHISSLCEGCKVNRCKFKNSL